MLKKLLKPIGYLLITCILIAKLPDYHYSYIRNHVASKVVKITEQYLRSGGTGVHVNTPHGQTLILTNAHVCEVENEKGVVFVTDESGRTMPRRVIEKSEFTDLCIVEGMPGASGLNLGSKPSIGEIVAVIGHPRLAPTTVSRGELTSQQLITVLDHALNPNDPKDTCNLPKNKIVTMMSFFGPVEVCAIEINAYLSNIVILPGNSGSPLVNKYGNLIGLAFAGDNEVHWAAIVAFEDIEKFLGNY